MKVCVHEDLYMNAYCCLLCKSQKLETTKMTINKRIDKKIVDINTVKYHLAEKRNELGNME